MPDRLSADEIEDALIGTPDWELAQGNKIVRTFQFKGFAEAMEFVNDIAALAEKANHHPDIDIRWNKVRLALTTHSRNGLTTNDFELAQAINDL